MRDLAERGVLDGEPGEYMVRARSTTSMFRPTCSRRSVRDRPPARHAKKTLNAASVIGLRFDADLLSDLFRERT